MTASDFRVPQHATADLEGATVVTTVSRGKHLLTRFAPADGSPGVTLHTHLKMEGVWHVHPPGSRWRRPAHEARVVLRTAGHEAVGFALGVVALVPTAAGGDRGRAPRPRPARPGLGRGRSRPPDDRRPRAHRRRRAPRPDLPGGCRIRLPLRAVLRRGAAPTHADRRGARRTTPGPTGPADARPQQDARRAHHDRRHPPGPAALGLRQERPAVPSLRHPRAPRRDGARTARSASSTGARAASRSAERETEGPGRAPRALRCVLQPISCRPP